MKYVFLALLSLSIASDVSVDVYNAQSPNANTEVVIETQDEEVKITVDDFTYGDSTYYYSGVNVYVNSNQGDATTDEVTVSASTYSSDGYYSNSASASSAEGDYVSAGETITVSDDGKGNVNTTYDANVYIYDANTGNYTYDYVDVATYSSTPNNSNETYEYSETNVSVGGYTFGDKANNVYNQNGEGYGVGEYWINAQALNSNTFGDFVYAFLVLAALGAAVILACWKILQENEKMHVTGFESPASYIRI